MVASVHGAKERRKGAKLMAFGEFSLMAFGGF